MDRPGLPSRGTTPAAFGDFLAKLALELRDAPWPSVPMDTSGP